MIALSLIILFVITGILHALWAMGIWFPIKDEKQLARTVVGFKGVDRMPAPYMAWCVVALTALGVIWIAQLNGWITLPMPIWLERLGGWVMTLILLGRGCTTYAFDKKWPQEEPFRWLNRRFYSPLILYLGVGTLLLM